MMFCTTRAPDRRPGRRVPGVRRCHWVAIHDDLRDLLATPGCCCPSVQPDYEALEFQVSRSADNTSFVRIARRLPSRCSSAPPRRDADWLFSAYLGDSKNRLEHRRHRSGCRRRTRGRADRVPDAGVHLAGLLRRPRHLLLPDAAVAGDRRRMDAQQGDRRRRSAGRDQRGRAGSALAAAVAARDDQRPELGPRQRRSPPSGVDRPHRRSALGDGLWRARRRRASCRDDVRRRDEVRVSADRSGWQAGGGVEWRIVSGLSAIADLRVTSGRQRLEMGAGTLSGTFTSTQFDFGVGWHIGGRQPR